MTPDVKRLLFPLRAPRAITLAWSPVVTLCAAIDGYFEAFFACMAHEEPDALAWRCMSTAPRDGTAVELLLRHVNYRYASTGEGRAEWEAVVEAHWIDFNGGGWVWFGMYGEAHGWRPLAMGEAE